MIRTAMLQQMGFYGDLISLPENKKQIIIEAYGEELMN